MWAAIMIGAAIMATAGLLIWVAIANAKDAAREKERKKQAQEASRARERYDEAFRKARGGAVDRARKRLRDESTGSR